MTIARIDDMNRTLSIHTATSSNVSTIPAILTFSLLALYLSYTEFTVCK